MQLSSLLFLVLLALVLWSLNELAREFNLAGEGFPFGWPYGEEDETFSDVSHKGGGSVPDPPKQKDVKLPPLPAAQPLPPPPPPPPPPTQDMAAVDQAAADAKRKAARGNGISQTLLAGETGGYNAGALGSAAGSGKKTLLG